MRSTVGGIRREATGEFLVNFFLHTPDRHGCSDLTWLAVRDHWSRGESRFLAQVVIKRSNRKTGEVVFGKVVRFESGVTEIRAQSGGSRESLHAGSLGRRFSEATDRAPVMRDAVTK